MNHDLFHLYHDNQRRFKTTNLGPTKPNVRKLTISGLAKFPLVVRKYLLTETFSTQNQSKSQSYGQHRYRPAAIRAAGLCSQLKGKQGTKYNKMAISWRKQGITGISPSSGNNAPYLPANFQPITHRRARDDPNAVLKRPFLVPF